MLKNAYMALLFILWSAAVAGALFGLMYTMQKNFCRRKNADKSNKYRSYNCYEFL